MPTTASVAGVPLEPLDDPPLELLELCDPPSGLEVVPDEPPDDEDVDGSPDVPPGLF